MRTIGDLIRSRRTTGDQRLPTPRVVIRFEDGWWTVHSDRGDVEIICIDEGCPRDRVYLCGNHKAADGEIDALIGDSRIGKKGDMPGTEAAIRAYLDGEPAPKPALTLVKSEDE
jgi:hypothetical protein